MDICKLYIKRLLFGRRGYRQYIILTVLVVVVVNAYFSRELVGSTMLALTPPPPLNHQLDHFRRSRKLGDYLDEAAEPLIQPSNPSCQESEVDVIALVSSAPARLQERDAIRQTWGQELPTYFFLGLPADHVDEQLVDNYMEAKLHSDIVVYNFKDSYHNLTLKTGSMLHWVQRTCPHVRYVLKTDDDVLVNPWTLNEVIKDHDGAALIGYQKNNTGVHRDEYTKWYLPRWLYSPEYIPEYLSGTAYLLHGEQIPKIYAQGLKTPLINLEDVYWTYLVSKQALGFRLIHDTRLSPYRPMLPLTCAYFTRATVHSLGFREILKTWVKLKQLSEIYLSGKDVCDFHKKYIDFEQFLY